MKPFRTFREMDAQFEKARREVEWVLIAGCALAIIAGMMLGGGP